MGTQDIVDIGKEGMFGISNKNLAVSFDSGIKQSGIFEPVQFDPYSIWGFSESPFKLAQISFCLWIKKKFGKEF